MNLWKTTFLNFTQNGTVMPSLSNVKAILASDFLLIGLY